MLKAFHPRTQRQITSYLQRLPHALIVNGLSKPARQAAAAHLLERMQECAQQQILIDSDDKSIGVEQVRQLYTKAHRRPAGNTINVIHIVEAHRLTLPAQNALLKLLEEPPDHVRFILTSQRADHLLPTIRSRSQHLDLLPLDFEVFKNHINQPDQAQQLYTLTGGDPFLEEELKTVLSDDQTVPDLARKLLQQPLGASLLAASGLDRDRNASEQLMLTFGRIARAGLLRAESEEQQRQWTARLAAAVEALDGINRQNSYRLIIDKLLLEFRTT